VIYVGGINHDIGYDSEGGDKKDLGIPHGQVGLIQKIVKANARTVVVLVGGSPMEMDAWLEQVPAVLLSWYSGMEGGNAIARVLFGDVNPSGKLPATFPKRLADSPAHTTGPKGFPGENSTVSYSEGVLVGYRWFDTKNIEPLFPFGFGLSYTTFEYSNLKLVRGTNASGPIATVEFEITNTGKRAGAEIAQVYVQDVKSSVVRPLKELKGFQKVLLQPGETQNVSVPLDRSAFAFFDADQGAWLVEAGEFKILAGSSVRDIRLVSGLTLDQNMMWKE
jgi:beta-glucosidase